MSLSMERPQFGISWESVQHHAKVIGLCAGFFGIGAWADGIHNGTASLPWLHQQAAVLRKVQTSDIPALKAEAGCEHWRAETNENLALQPTVVDPAQIPKDCPKAAK